MSEIPPIQHYHTHSRVPLLAHGSNTADAFPQRVTDNFLPLYLTCLTGTLSRTAAFCRLCRAVQVRLSVLGGCGGVAIRLYQNRR